MILVFFFFMLFSRKLKMEICRLFCDFIFCINFSKMKPKKEFNYLKKRFLTRQALCALRKNKNGCVGVFTSYLRFFYLLNFCFTVDVQMKMIPFFVSSRTYQCSTYIILSILRHTNISDKKKLLWKLFTIQITVKKLKKRTSWTEYN